jgi:hypothetical protein
MASRRTTIAMTSSTTRRKYGTGESPFCSGTADGIRL